MSSSKYLSEFNLKFTEALKYVEEVLKKINKYDTIIATKIEFMREYCKTPTCIVLANIIIDHVLGDEELCHELSIYNHKYFMNMDKKTYMKKCGNNKNAEKFYNILMDPMKDMEEKHIIIIVKRFGYIINLCLAYQQALEEEKEEE